MKRNLLRNVTVLAVVAAIIAGCVFWLSRPALAQFSRGWRGGRYNYENLPERDVFPGDRFTFCRIRYSSRGNFGCFTDYPASDLNFSLRLEELTTIKVNRDERGEIRHAVVDLTDDDLFNYPFIYMLEVGGLYFSDEERDMLRAYLLRGGFLLVDDFWGARAWDNWAYEIDKVLPSEDYPISDIPLSHPIFHVVFELKEVPQIPSIGHYSQWLRTGISYERGHGYRDPTPHCRGIFSRDGRLMVVMMHNSDLGDGWEREAENQGYFEDFSAPKAYPMGINIVVYAMTH